MYEVSFKVTQFDVHDNPEEKFHALESSRGLRVSGFRPVLFCVYTV